MATAIASLATGKPVSEEVAMTGEITLTGQVLPIGGLREKVLAAQRAGISKVVFPRENEPDLEELPDGDRARSSSSSPSTGSRKCSRSRSTASCRSRRRTGDLARAKGRSRGNATGRLRLSAAGRVA